RAWRGAEPRVSAGPRGSQHEGRCKATGWLWYPGPGAGGLSEAWPRAWASGSAPRQVESGTITVINMELPVSTTGGEIRWCSYHQQFTVLTAVEGNIMKPRISYPAAAPGIYTAMDAADSYLVGTELPEAL